MEELQLDLDAIEEPISYKFPYLGIAPIKPAKTASVEEVNAYTMQWQIRKDIGLPIKKDLVYYRLPYGSSPAIPVLSFAAKKFVTVSGKECDWYDVKLELQDHAEVSIHGDFFIEMQKPDFISEVNTISE